MWHHGSKAWDHDQGSGSSAIGIGISSILRDQESGCAILVGTETKIGHAIGIKDHKFGYKNGINDEKTSLVTTLRWQNLEDLVPRQFPNKPFINCGANPLT